MFQLILFHFILKITLERNECISESIFETFGFIFQQGFQPKVGKYFSRKLWILTLTFPFLIIYNLYTSTVLSVIVNSTPKIPSTLDELLKSPLQLHFDDISYMHNYFNYFPGDTTVKRILAKNENEEVPLFLSVETAIPLLKNFQIAFYCERMAAYPLLEKSLTPEEVCQLRETEKFFISDNTNMFLILQRDSQYLEMFRYGIMKAREFGLIDRQILIHRHRKPMCQACSPLELVCIEHVKGAFHFLGIVFGISFGLLGFERYIFSNIMKKVLRLKN